MNILNYRDPLTLALDIARDRTMIQILWELEKKKQELLKIQDNLPSIDHEELFNKLNMLVDSCFVSKTIHDHQFPVVVDYILTNRGAKFLKCIRKMQDVGIEVMFDYEMDDVLVEGGYIELTELEDIENLDNEGEY